MNGITPPPRARLFSRQHRRRLLFLLGVIVVGIIAGYIFLSGGGTVKTGNAYLKSNRVAISAEISGRLESIHVVENQQVKKGAPLFDLDSSPYLIAVDRLKAELRHRENEIRALQARYREAQARLKRGREDLAFARREVERVQRLARDELASESQLDQVRHLEEQASQELEVIKQEMSAILAELGGDVEVPVTDHPRYLAAEAELESARLDLAHTSVHAPANGMVTQLERFRPGEYVEAGVPLFALVETDQVWVEANLKETELETVRAGQPVSIEVDAYAGKHLRGEVESIGAATGSEFSVLPPQNASGNWIKVTQRIPVRIRLRDGETGLPLRLGMSAHVTIDTSSAGDSAIGKTLVQRPADATP